MESRPQVLEGSLPSKVHLWDSELGQNESSVDACWVTDLNSSRDALWPFLSDTSSLNQRLGLPEMEFEERDGRLSGVSGRILLRQEWVEIPWEWETGKWLLAERRYSRGFARAVRVRYLLEDHHDGTRFTVSIGWIPTYWWSPLVLRSINHWLRRQYARVLRDIDKLAGNSEEKPTAPIASVETRVTEDRLRLGVRKTLNLFR